jgi:hypothetical protein
VAPFDTSLRSRLADRLVQTVSVVVFLSGGGFAVGAYKSIAVFCFFGFRVVGYLRWVLLSLAVVLQPFKSFSLQF